MRKSDAAKFIVLLVLLTSLFLTSSLYAGTEPKDTSPDIQRIIKRGKILVAMYSIDAPPFYMSGKDGALTGIDVHLIRGFAKMLGVDAEFKRTAKTYDEIIDMVVRHEADVGISKLSITFKRAMRVRFSEPYIVLRRAMLLNRLELAKISRGRDIVEVVRNLEGKIGVVATSSYYDSAKDNFKKATVVVYPSWQKTMEALGRGEILALYRDEMEVKKIIKEDPSAALKFMKIVLKDCLAPKAVIVPPDSGQLLSLLNVYIRTLDLKLPVDRLLNDYDGIIAEIDRKSGLPDHEKEN